MRIEDRIRTSAQRVADEVDPPAVDIVGIRKGAHAGQRRRIAIVATVLATILVGVVAPRVVDTFSSTPIPPIPADRPTQPTRPVQSGVVWADNDGIHIGDTVMKVPFATQRKCPEEDDGMCPQFTSMALVAGGVVYGEASTLRVWFQPWTGPARVIGKGASVGPGGDPDGTTAAWFEDMTDIQEDGERYPRSDGIHSRVWDLVMFDTATGTETARVTQKMVPAKRPDELLSPAVGWREHTQGNGINEVTPDTVSWNGGWTFDRRTGRTSPVRLDDKPTTVFDVESGRVAMSGDSDTARVVSPEGDVTWKSRRGQFDGFVLKFSPDGRYVAGVTSGDRHYHPLVADTRTSEVFIPYRGNIYPWIGWGYDDTLMVVQDFDGDRQDRLLACEVREGSCQRLTSKGGITLPNGG